MLIVGRLRAFTILNSQATPLSRTMSSKTPQKSAENLIVSHAPLLQPHPDHGSFQVRLTPKEEEICDLLVEVAEHLKQKNPSATPLTLRIAGGWVRDKLLGRESKDIDVAIDHLHGYEFAQQVNEYLQSKGHAIENLGKISANPDKSKHLETATGKVLGLDIDFVNLRQEEYCQDTRIPSIRLGTPSEDARRRDLTINSLFYNLHTKKVEDFTGQGLSDLVHGRIRTPLPPKQTFLDDPLRVLRVIRFASRYRYHMTDDIVHAVKDPQIRTALENKVSKERVGIELEKMLRGPDPVESIRYITDFGLYGVVFEPPPNVSVASGQEALERVSSMDWLLQPVTKLPRLLNRLRNQMDETSRFILYLAAATWPYKDVVYMEKKKEYPVSRYLVRDSIKLSALDSDLVCALHHHSPTIQDLVDQISKGVVISRRDLGWIIRKAGERPLLEHWTGILFLSMASEFNESDSLETKSKVLERYEALANLVEDYEMWDVWHWKPMLDGGEISKLLSVKPGPVLGKALEEVMTWQLSHTEGTPEECRKHIQDWYAKSL